MIGVFKSLSSQTANLTIDIKGIANTDGYLRIGIYGSKDDFLVEGKEFAGGQIQAVLDSVKYVFEHIPHGNYSVAIFHDMDSNGKLNRNMLGIPVEGYGFSNESTMGIPDFEDALFELNSDKKIIVTMKYLNN